MLLHGHTRESLDEMCYSDRLLLWEMCSTGVMGPLTAPVHTFRLLSKLHSLQATVMSFGSSKTVKPEPFSKQFPEVAKVVKVKEKSGGVDLQDADAIEGIMARLGAERGN